MHEQILKLAGKSVTAFLQTSDTIKVQVWGVLSYNGKSMWKVSRAYSWDSAIEFHEADVAKIIETLIYLR